MNNANVPPGSFRGQGGGGGRRRRPPVPVHVVSVSRITPRLVSVRFKGVDLNRFAQAAPTAHLKVFLPGDGQEAPSFPVMTPQGQAWPDDAPRPTMRTYTLRSFDPDDGSLEIQFLLHGEGPASDWAERASVGDRLAIGGPGGRFSVDHGAAQWWIAGDESALPAVGSLLDALPPTATARVHLEVAGPQDEFELKSAADTTITWHHRRGPDVWGAELLDAAAGATLEPGTQTWIACEASAMRSIRRQLLERAAISRSTLTTRGYWRVGVADHPDHDYGDD